MLVKQLIHQLQMANPELPVIILHGLDTDTLTMSNLTQIGCQTMIIDNNEANLFILVDDSTRAKKE